MKVTYSVIALFPFTSMGIIAIKVVEELTKLGIDVGLNVLQERDKIDYSLYSPAVQEALKKGFREDSIGIFFSYPDSYPAVRCKVNVGYTGADSTGWYQTEGANPPADFCNKFVDYMLTPSDYSRQIMKDCGVEVPIELFPHGIDPELLVPSDTSRNFKQFTYCYVGELSRRKGSIDLIEAFIDISKIIPEARLLLRANTHMKYYDGQTIYDLCKDHKNIELIWTDKDQRDVTEFYKQADCYLYPSRADWFGMTVFEALAVGVPVIATATNGYYEFLKDKILEIPYKKQVIGNEHPYLKGEWNIADKELFRLQMLRVYFEYEYEKKKALETAEWLRNDFTWQKVTKDYLVPFLENVYQKHWSENKGEEKIGFILSMYNRNIKL